MDFVAGEIFENIFIEVTVEDMTLSKRRGKGAGVQGKNINTHMLGVLLIVIYHCVTNYLKT